MSAQQPTIIYTLTDEAPLLATYAFLPVIRKFAEAAGIDVKTSDISVAARILGAGQGEEAQRIRAAMRSFQAGLAETARAKGAALRERR